MSQKLPVNKVEWIEDTSKFKEVFIKNYNEESDEGYFLVTDVQYRLLPEKMKIQKVGKLVTNLHDETEYAIQALNHGLILKKVHRVIKFNQKAWLKPYIDMNIR